MGPTYVATIYFHFLALLPNSNLPPALNSSPNHPSDLPRDLRNLFLTHFAAIAYPRGFATLLSNFFFFVLSHSLGWSSGLVE
ncbi:hypothetical protein VNO77_20450 [Canavalia gladiata]|uniref:Uncharacterized protein n=1 Tax=Canavalia gladiata TaxID=3824 RepID=A0AAN9QQK4_CANGL